MRQDQDERDQQNDLALKREKERNLGFAQRDKALLEGALKCHRKADGKIDAQRPCGHIDQCGILIEQLRDQMRCTLHQTPHAEGEHAGDEQVVFNDLPHAVSPLGAVIITEDGLCALRQTEQRHLQHLRDRGQDGHGADGQITAVLLQRNVEGHGQQAFG